MTSVERVIESLVFIEWNMTENINAAVIASEIGCSTNYFRKVFKEVTGYSVETYLLRRRLTEAFRTLLANPGKIVNNTVQEFQFKHFDAFCNKLFKQFNILPAQIGRKQSLQRIPLQEAMVYEVINKCQKTF